jgi:hypothetical protein
VRPDDHSGQMGQLTPRWPTKPPELGPCRQAVFTSTVCPPCVPLSTGKDTGPDAPRERDTPTLVVLPVPPSHASSPLAPRPFIGSASSNQILRLIRYGALAVSRTIVIGTSAVSAKRYRDRR